MKELNNIDNQWLTKPTGDPFVDTGGYIIEYLFQRDYLKDKNILELIEYVSNIYVNQWGGKLHAFFLNSTITQPAFKGQRKIDETLKFYKGLIEETEIHQFGFCRISGRETSLFTAGRDNHILSGSGTFINFHGGFESGLQLSKEVLIRMFFVPLGLLQLSDKVAMLSSNVESVTKFFVKNNFDENMTSLQMGKAEGVLRSSFNNPANALFDFADSYISKNLKEELEIDDDRILTKSDITLNLYHFTNFGASPDVNFHVLDSKVFKFYAFCHRIKIRDEWKKFIRANYQNSKYGNAIFNEKEEVWINKEETIDFTKYQIWKNFVLENLLAGKSILKSILKWNAIHSFPFVIVENYQTIIRNMEKRTIEKIKQIADFVTIDRDDDFISKSIKRLNGEKSAHGLRLFFLKLNGENYKNDSLNPLITVQDYAEYLFPDGGNWRELRDVLLIAIYEKLHEINKKIALPEIEEDEENTISNLN